MNNFFNGATAVFSKKVDSEILLEWRTFPSTLSSPEFTI
jgi:hypothetical protein